MAVHIFTCHSVPEELAQPVSALHRDRYAVQNMQLLFRFLLFCFKVHIGSKLSFFYCVLLPMGSH